MAARTRRVEAVRRRKKKTLSREEIHALRGKLKLNTGDKPFAEWWTEQKREEKELEERRFQRLAALGKRNG
jgi:hypothetical protein